MKLCWNASVQFAGEVSRRGEAVVTAVDSVSSRTVGNCSQGHAIGRFHQD